MKKMQCRFCSYIYNQEEGIPEQGIAPGTPIEDFPEDWMCPDCGASKYDFDEVEW